MTIRELDTGCPDKTWYPYPTGLLRCVWGLLLKCDSACQYGVTVFDNGIIQSQRAQKCLVCGTGPTVVVVVKAKF